MSCLVLSGYCNYPEEMVDPFRNSLKESGFMGELAILNWTHCNHIPWELDIYRLFLFKEYLSGSPYFDIASFRQALILSEVMVLESDQPTI